MHESVTPMAINETGQLLSLLERFISFFMISFAMSWVLVWSRSIAKSHALIVSNRSGDHSYGFFNDFVRRAIFSSFISIGIILCMNQ